MAVLTALALATGTASSQDVGTRNIIIRGTNTNTANYGQLTLGAVTGIQTYELPAVGGTLLVSTGGALTLGTTSQAGSLILHDGNGQTGTIQTPDLVANAVYTLPATSGTLVSSNDNTTFVRFAPGTPQNGVTTGATYLYDLAYSGAPGATVGARIASTATGVNSNATALTLSAAGTGTGNSVALDVTAGTIRASATSVPDAADMTNRELAAYNTSTNIFERVTVAEALGGTPVVYGGAPQTTLGTGATRLFDVAYSGTVTGAAAGARIRSNGIDANASATGLTVEATSNGVGSSVGLSVSASGGTSNIALAVVAGNSSFPAGATVTNAGNSTFGGTTVYTPVVVPNIDGSAAVATNVVGTYLEMTIDNNTSGGNQNMTFAAGTPGQVAIVRYAVDNTGGTGTITVVFADGNTVVAAGAVETYVTTMLYSGGGWVRLNTVAI